MLKPRLLVDQMVSESMHVHRLVSRLKDHVAKPGSRRACIPFPLQAFSFYLSSAATDLQDHLSQASEHTLPCAYCKQQTRRIRRLLQS
jgi:hypothetical protein